MVKSIFSLNKVTFVLLILIGAFWGFIPQSHAQSVQEWSDPMNLSRSGAASNPSLVVDSQGVLHVLWLDKFDGYKYVESTDGLTWSTPVTVDFPFSMKQIVPPVFLADPNGVIHIFWLSEKNDLFYAQALDENLDTPAAWRVRTKLHSSVYDFDVNRDAQGRLHLGYVRNPVPVSGSGGPIVLAPNSGVAGVHYQRSVTGGNNWTAPSLLYESPYFRSLTFNNARIRIAVSEAGEEVYAVWDDQPQKRIFMATSLDGGASWSSVRELITPQASLGYRVPYHADIALLQGRILVTWQVGEPGVQCVPYSSLSSDGGETWDEPIKILTQFSGCPEKSEFLPLDAPYSVILFKIQNDLSISAWNGTQWSNPEIQQGPSSVTNPATFDSVVLSCEQVQAYQEQLYVAGCDQGSGGDIWFLKRKLSSLEELFPPPSAWGGDLSVTKVPQAITSLSSIADAANHIHSVWVQSSTSLTGPLDAVIQYSRWDGDKWTKPAPVIKELPGLPLNLTLQMDSHQRLLLSWIDQSTGELLFSWASSERAELPVEWIPPIVISSPSQLTNSPDMLVDASDRIVIAYAITLNEERGVYVIQSSDLGSTWSSPVRVFDAMAVNWEMVDQPKLTITEDGRLHILFTQYTLLGSQQAVGLYYSQSMDGGLAWTAPQVVNQHPVEWSEITAFKQTLHRFWQEKDESVISTYHQISSDGGITWSQASALPSDLTIVSNPEVSLDGSGNVHLMQIAQDDGYILQEWDWNSERAQLVEAKKLGIPKENSDIAVESGMTSQGVIYALVQSEESLLTGDTQTSVVSFRRSLELTEAPQPFLASISTPSSTTLSTPDPSLQLTPTVTSVQIPVDDTGSRTVKNAVGLVLIISVVLLVLFLMLPRRNKAVAKLGRSK